MPPIDRTGGRTGGDAPSGTPAPIPPDVPTRESLLHQIRTANRWAWPWLGVRLAVILVLFYWIDWPRAFDDPITSVVAVLAVIGPYVMSLLRLLARPRKRLENLKETTRFGDLDRRRLIEIYQQTLSKLGLPDRGVPVYVTSDKDLNAAALQLGRWFDRVNGVYLHRQVLHRLTPAEIQDWLGHELGHYHRFSLTAMDFRFVTMLTGALVGLFVVQWVSFTGFLGFIIVTAIASGFWWIDSLPWYRNGQAIEHLCDDLGMQVGGIGPSVSGLLKSGRDMELRTAIELELQAKNLGNEMITPQELAAAVERAIPYGDVDEVELYDRASQQIAAKTEKNRKASVGGFLSYAWDADDLDDEEDRGEHLQQRAKMINAMRRLDWESVVDDPKTLDLDERQVQRLVELIERDPGGHLFKVPELATASDGIHPPIAARIRYLWHNRNSRTPLEL